MGMQIYFVYDDEDKSRFEIEEVSCQGLQDFFEIYENINDPIEIAKAQNSALNTAFARDFPKLRELDFSTEPPADEETESLLEDGPEAYIGPSFEPEILERWALTWIRTIEEANEAERRVLLPYATEGFDWNPTLLKDLREIHAQAECAKNHRVSMHIEMY